jgi:hypothetical protein
MLENVIEFDDISKISNFLGVTVFQILKHYQAFVKLSKVFVKWFCLSSDQINDY